MKVERRFRGHRHRSEFGNLPDRRTSFVGRDRELVGLSRTLHEARLITLTGAGGCGKTTLAVETARAVAGGFSDGAWLAELGPVSDPNLVPGAVAGALGILEEPGRSFLDVVAEAMTARNLLLVLDNCEHVLEAAAGLCDEILSRCLEVRILATSRRQLGVEGEQIVPVPPLGVPEEEAGAEDVVTSGAGRLFLDRARAVSPSMRIEEGNAASVASVCRRLDGIPLAIELAAARVGLLTPQEIDDRLADRFRLLRSGARDVLPRHRTLQALIDWSHDLLKRDEAVLYRRLGVFVGGFTLPAAEQVCSADPLTPDAVLDVLGRLVEQSLVVGEDQEGHTRYRMLETVREHALERLQDSGEEDELRARHLRWFVSFVERSGDDLVGPAQADASRQIAREFSNVRAAFAWALSSDDVEASLRLVTIRRFWQTVQGHLDEGVAWLRAALERADRAEPPLRAKALAQATDFARVLGDYGSARSYAERCLAIVREVEDPAAAGRVLYTLGRAESESGNDERASEVTKRSVAIARESDDRQQLGERLSQLGEITYHLGAGQEARPMLEEAIELAREVGDDHTVADAFRTLGAIERDAGKVDAARASLGEALAFQREISDWTCAAQSLSVLGAVALDRGDLEGAGALFAEALSIQPAIGAWFRTVDCLWGLAAVSADLGQLDRAARLLGVEAMMRSETQNVPFRLASPERHDAVEAALRERIGDAAFAGTYEEGRGMGTEEARAYAVAEYRPGAPAETLPTPEPVGAPARSVLRREGEYWTIVFEEDAFRLRDAKGLRYLARLFAEPGREFHALDLVGASSTSAGPHEPGEETRSRAQALGDAGALLDPQAKASYQRRLEELQDEMEDAEAIGNSDRVERARSEREFIARELAQAVGLGGRDRVAASASERARVNATRAIKAALSRIAEHSSALGRHLEATIRTGTYCSYQPDPRVPVTWQL